MLVVCSVKYSTCGLRPTAFPFSSSEIHLNFNLLLLRPCFSPPSILRYIHFFLSLNSRILGILLVSLPPVRWQETQDVSTSAEARWLVGRSPYRSGVFAGPRTTTSQALRGHNGTSDGHRLNQTDSSSDSANERRILCTPAFPWRRFNPPRGG